MLLPNENNFVFNIDNSKNASAIKNLLYKWLYSNSLKIPPPLGDWFETISKLHEQPIEF